MVQNPADIHSKFAEVFNAGSLEGLVALYEPDAVLMASPGPEARGTDAIRAAYREYLAAKPAIQAETTGVNTNAGGIALTHCRWVMTGTGADGKPFEARGTSAEVLRLQPDGRWLVAIDNPTVG
jgi:uncharacterized protein (TIGR02246 family)